MSTFSKITTQQLVKIAAAGGIFVGVNAIIMKMLMQRRLQESPYVLEAKNVVMGNQGFVKFMGEPISFGSVDLGDTRKNYSTEHEARFEIPLKGSEHEGTLVLYSTREVKESLVKEEDKYFGWKLQNLEVTIKDKPNHKLVLVNSSAK